MQENETDILIIGGGLTALCLAYYLQDYNIQIIEARDRLGGRIFTQYDEGKASIEKGATWFMQNHTALISLLKELQIDSFEQHFGNRAFYDPHPSTPWQLVDLPPNGEASYRIKDGTSVLINELANRANEDRINIGEVVSRIKEEENHLLVETNKNSYKAKLVISTLPPKLLTTTIKFTPSLPESFLHIAGQTHTWMGESIKIGLRFKTPFWQKDNSSPTVFSNAGPVTELYNHSNYEGNLYALKGFLSGPYHALTKEQRLEIVLKQLSKYYGEAIRGFIEYEELVWQNEGFTFSQYDDNVFAHQNNGHPVYQEPYFNNKLHIAGAETSAEFSGKMEAAIRSAKKVSSKIIKQYANL